MILGYFFLLIDNTRNNIIQHNHKYLQMKGGFFMISYINFTMFHIVFRVRRGRDRIVVYYYQIICVVFFVNRETKLILGYFFLVLEYSRKKHYATQP
jgi:D-alanyl-lipoteichoic acid acyltransferase DltB (MBOAT superfamily)